MQAGVDAFNSGDLDSFLRLIHPDVVWEEGGVVFPDLPPAYHGHDGVRRWYRDAVVEAWETVTLELLDTHVDEQGRVVGQFRLFGRGRTSEVDVEMRFIQTFTVDDGLLVHRTVALA